jgi:hypothetical protein
MKTISILEKEYQYKIVGKDRTPHLYKDGVLFAAIVCERGVPHHPFIVSATRRASTGRVHYMYSLATHEKVAMGLSALSYLGQQDIIRAALDEIRSANAEVVAQ